MFENDFGHIFQEEEEYTSLNDVKKLCEELVFKHLDKEFEYGYVKDGKFKKHPSQKDIIKYHKLLSPEDFEKYGGGTCFDYVEYEQKWLSDKGVDCRKIWISEEMPMDQTEHTFVMIECENQFIWVEPVLKKFKGVHVFSNKRDLFKTAAYWVFMNAKNPEHMDGVKYTVFDYTNSAVKYNTRVEDAASYILGNAKWLFDDMVKESKGKVVEEAYRHSMYDRDDPKTEQKKMIKLYQNIIFLKNYSNLKKMTKTECVDYLCETYNILAEIYDTIEEDYDEKPVKTSRLGFAKKPKNNGKHRKDIDRLIWEIRSNIIELNRSWSREGAKTIVGKMLDVFEYEQRELNQTAPVFNKLLGNSVAKISNKVIGSIHESYCDFDMMELDDVIQEAKLSTDDRNDLDDSQFGIPELRKYPLTDEKHVLQAVRFFNKAPDEYKEELAKNIVKRAKELGMDWENWESLKPYLGKKNKDKVVKESPDWEFYDIEIYQEGPIFAATFGGLLAADKAHKHHKKKKKRKEAIAAGIGAACATGLAAADAFYQKQKKEDKVSGIYHPIQTTHSNATKNDKIYEVKDLKYDKVYFGTPNEYKDGIDCDRPLFVTPFKSLACIFAVSKNKEELGIPHGRYNCHYDEWAHPKNEYIDEIHMQVEGLDDATEHTKDMTGYVYEVDISDLKDHIGKYDWMSPQREYLIYDIDHIDWSNQKKVNVKVHWTGQHSDDPKYHPYQEAVDINSLRQQCQEVFQQASQIHYGCLDENGERITASPFKDSWKMISTYHSQSIQSMEQSKLGVCFEHSFYVAKLLKDRGLPCQTFFLNCNIDHTQPPEEDEDTDIQQESESIAVEQHNNNDMSFWHQFTIVPNDVDSIVLIETSLTHDKNGVFLVANMDDLISHLIQTFDLNLPQEDLEIMKQDLIDVSNFTPRDGDTYIGYIDQAYLNGKFIKNEIRINHQTKTMKTYWQYLSDNQYLSEDGMKINEQIQQMDDNTAFDIINLLNASPLFTDEGLQFHKSFFNNDKIHMSVSEMESALKGFVQESYMGIKHNALKEKFQYIPLTKQSIKKYAPQGDFQHGLEHIHVTKDTKGAIYINKNHVVVGYVVVTKKSNGERWITALEVSNEYKDNGYDTDLLQIAVDDFEAEYLSIKPNQSQALSVYQRYGFQVERQTDSMIVLKLNKNERNDINESIT